MMVSTLVIYDIPDDKVRNKIAEACLDYGLERIQWSAFFGRTDRNRREEIMLRFTRVMGKSEGNIQMYVICEKDIRLRKELQVKATPKTQKKESPAASQWYVEYGLAKRG